MTVRVRFAPSPTGALHLGSALTAVANFLFARRAGGSIVLRVDDTDPQRSDRRFERTIRQDAEWLGLRFDEGPDEGGPFGPYRQSERGPIYVEHARRLLDAGLAYEWWGGEGDDAEADEEARVAGATPAIRFRVPREDVVIADAARGPVRVAAGAVRDTVLLRADGTATYTLATVVDDALFEISHVIRGEDHLTNTARQLLLAKALGLRPPRFAHTALLVGDDGTKLSKRRGAPSIAELRGEGYPPEALLNYLAQLACPSIGDEPQLLGQLAARFELKGLSRGTSRFDRGRLDWLSQQHLKRLNALELARRVGGVLTIRGISAHPAQLTLLGPALRGCHSLVEAADEVEAIVSSPRLRRLPADPSAPMVAALLATERAAWPETYLELADADAVLAAVVEAAAETGLERRDVLHATRLVLTNREKGLALRVVVAAIERDDAIARCLRFADVSAA